MIEFPYTDEWQALRAEVGTIVAKRIYTGRALHRKVDEAVERQSLSDLAEVLHTLITRSFPEYNDHS